MKIKEIIQTPVGTIVSFYSKIPSRVMGKTITVDGINFHKIKGVPISSDIDIFIEKTQELKVGQTVIFV
ncbi:hypothetical protein J7S27_01905 [Carnobacteriaceae bacterium zg-C25]|nr:hypothetical protein J7S27_01905 [Carnobacteriaceae bacterium zg-C25]